MNILILEDEERNANRLIRLLKDIDPSFRIIGPLTSIEVTIAYLRANASPDLILADIRLSDGLSFEALKEAPSFVPIVFTTAFDEYAVQAFKYNSFDYLLKPIDAVELAAAIEKVNLNGKTYSDESLRQLFDALQRSDYKYRERFLLPFRDGYRIFNVKDINHIFTENKIVRLFFKDGTSETVFISMDELEKQLDPARFFRANRQFIVNMESIRFLGNYFKGKLILRLNDYPQLDIIISKDKAPLLKDWINR
ncbi:MAG: LytTR family DNA-binding domain-containing protein [Bacteroidota bacterium]|nr:LytTR family DNA-binding domain-containing protein [Bacteroidota bacterium]